MNSKVHVSFIASQANARSQQGSMLIESMIAILIFSMGILALVGLQAAMIRNTTASNYRAEASHIAQQTLGALWADPANVAASVTDVSALPNGKSVVTLPAAGQVKIVITWQQPGETEVHNVTTSARVGGV